MISKTPLPGALGKALMWCNLSAVCVLYKKLLDFSCEMVFKNRLSQMYVLQICLYVILLIKQSNIFLMCSS